MVSVVIPTYNGARFIREAILSVLSQSLKPREVIVVDDCSRDGTCDVVGSLAGETDIPIRLLRLRENSGGPGRPMNEGFAAAEGHYVAMLDQDDRMSSVKLECAAALLGEHPSAGLFFGQAGFMTETGSPHPRPASLVRKYPRQAGCLTPREAMRGLLRRGYGYGGAGGTVIRKRAWEDTGRFRERFNIAWDCDFALRMMLRGWSVAYAPVTVFYHRVHDGNLASAEGGARLTRQYVDLLTDCLNSPDLDRRDVPLAKAAVKKALLTAAREHAWSRQYEDATGYYLSVLRGSFGVWEPVVGLMKLGMIRARAQVRRIGSQRATPVAKAG
jgi:glycosyltransferase involved in cell wall biosynthesis